MDSGRPSALAAASGLLHVPIAVAALLYAGGQPFPLLPLSLLLFMVWVPLVSATLLWQPARLAN